MSSPFICARCLRARSTFRYGSSVLNARSSSSAADAPAPKKDGQQSEATKDGEKGAMSRLLSQMSEENVETGGRSAAKAVEEAGFSDELKERLLDKIANANFKNEHASAFAQANMPAGAGKGTRDIAAARPWSGDESTEDAALRMLTDAHKPMRTASRVPGLRGPPGKIDTGRPSQKPAAGARIANARDKTSMYEFTKDAGLSKEEREKFRQQMKHKFTVAGRTAPATIQGLASLANERIEDAIASGKFKNLPRGKKIERDHNASSPFIDTTEYLMNKIIQRQDIVPPWIEKQQELVSTATRFRGRLRADWRRHVSRVIASRGGNLQTQIQLAQEYALAEAVDNPPKKKEEKLNAVDNAGHVSQITLSGELKAAPAYSPAPAESSSADIEDAKLENEIKIMEQTFNDDGSLKTQPDETVIVSTEQPEQSVPPIDAAPRRPTVPPFRDAQWEQTERAYLAAAVENLNSLTRSYNLMAPQLARKPYFYLDRELKSCYADVAPQIADAIRDRAFAPKIKGVEVLGHKPGGVLDNFSVDKVSQVYDERKPQYGFKEFWKDLFMPKTS